MRTGVELLAGLAHLTVSRMACWWICQQPDGWQEKRLFGRLMQRHARFSKDERSLNAVYL